MMSAFVKIIGDRRNDVKLEKIPSDILVDVATASEFRRSAEGWIKMTEVGGQVRRDVERGYDALQKLCPLRARP
jgi:hypothetical protein